MTIVRRRITGDRVRAPASPNRLRALLGGDRVASIVLLLPFLLVFGVFSWYPIVRSLVMSVQSTNLTSAATFVGLKNFSTILSDPLLGIAVRNTLWFALLALVLVTRFRSRLPS